MEKKRGIKMKGYFRFPMISGNGVLIDSAIIFGDIESTKDFQSGISYYVKDPKIHCRFIN